jgi:DNA-binding MarR family transcriptional regulator
MIVDNLVYRRPDPADRRAILLHLSPRGRILHQRAARRVDEEQTRLLRAIGDGGELQVALPLLTAVLDGQTVEASARKTDHMTPEHQVSARSVAW